MSEQQINTASESQQFNNKEIVDEEFYVLDDHEQEGDDQLDLETTLPTTTTKVSIVEPEKYRKEENVDEGFDLLSTDEHEDEIPKPKEETQDAENPDNDFFEEGEDEDIAKKQVVEEISGMIDTAEAETEDAETEYIATKVKREASEVESDSLVADGREDGMASARSSKHSTIQFKPRKMDSEKEDIDSSRSMSSARVSSKQSVTERIPGRKSAQSVDTETLRGSASRARRVSSVHQLMKLSRKSLLALTSSADGSVMARKSAFGNSLDKSMLFPSSNEPYEFSRRSSYSQSKRSTFHAEMGPRYRQSEDEDMLAEFDFGAGDTAIYFEVLPEEEEVISVHEEEGAVRLEREPFYERHDRAAHEVIIRKMRNFIFHKKLSMYFKRKKMDYATKEVEWSYDSHNKYLRKLGAYGEFMDFIHYERVRVTQEVEDAKKLRDEKFNRLTNMFKKMQDREGEIGYGLINTKTGNAIPDKFVERLLRRQNTQLIQVSSMRLTFIRLKGMVQEKLDQIARLNEIAPGFLLGDYEQLKSDNRAYSDKIEEKDEELTRLRSKCANTIQVLAHLREKTSALENDLYDLVDERGGLEFGHFVVRSRVNEQKQSRDNIRHALNKMRNESGLLTQPTLLRDMERGLADVELLTDQLAQITKEHRKKAKQIKSIRRKIEEFTDMRKKSWARLTTLGSTIIQTSLQKEMDKPYRVYKGRPSLMVPIIEDSAFESLKTIKPRLTYDRRQRGRHVNHIKRMGG